MDGILLGTAYTWTEARRRGATRRQIQADGVAVGRGVFVSRSVTLDLESRCRAWARALPADAAFSHGTAASFFEAPVWVPPLPNVALTPRRVLPQWDGLVVHGRRLAPEDVVVHRGLRLTSAAQTFLDLAAVLPPPDLVALGDALLRDGHLTPDELTSRLGRADRVRGVVRARACAPLLSPLAMSRPESVLRYWIIAAGLPAPQVQIPIRDRWSVVRAHADLGFEEWKVALEYEGRQHADADQFGRDIDRYSLMGAEGWLTLRFASRHLGSSSIVVDRTRRALISRGWRPPAQLTLC
jgi:hypothetical protein